MTATIQEEFDRLLRAYQADSPLALLLDYDGTLTAQESPGQADLSARARWLLSCLASQPGLVVAILSERRLDNLKELVRLDGVVYAGSSGLELKDCTIVQPWSAELAPIPGWNKSAAVERILEEMDAETFPFYAGDSDSDRAAFLLVAARGGMTVGVGPHAPSEAQHRVADPDDLIDLLARLLPAITVAGLK